MSCFAVIDTETTWSDELMSIGVAIADSETFYLCDQQYYILTPIAPNCGMYVDALYARGIRPDLEGARQEVMKALVEFLSGAGVTRIFAYNASFDYQHLPELQQFAWYDIMKLAAYRQYNAGIPRCADCYGTGRLKRGYGVESIYRMLSGDPSYCELHNALSDAVDELGIMRMMQKELSCYEIARIGKLALHS